jgi:hypothetical protein
MKIKNWIAYVQDRRKWKEVVEKAKTFKKKKKKKIAWILYSVDRSSRYNPCK